MGWSLDGGGAEVGIKDIPTKQKIIKSASDFPVNIDSTVEYLVDGIIDMSGVTIQVPSTGIYISGHNFDVSQLVCNDDNYTMFESPVGGSGNVLFRDFSISTSGASSKVYELNGFTGDEAIELERVNYNGCSSLGEINNYRQGLESGTGRFGGSPELTMSGDWSGMRVTTSITRGLSDGTDLFKAGSGLSFSGRFITDMNLDLPSTGSFFDFSGSNFVNDESLVVQGAFVTRLGSVNPSDSTITPNVDQDSIKSNWDSNTGLPNTTKYIKGNATSEVTTTISAIDTYYPLLGTFTIERQTHFDMPSNGEFRLLTGTGDYLVSGDLVIEGSANDVIDIRVTRSSDGGLTYPDEINHISRVINNISGSRDVAFFPLSFIANLDKNDRVRIEVENKSSTGNVTAELDSFFILSEI